MKKNLMKAAMFLGVVALLGGCQTNQTAKYDYFKMSTHPGVTEKLVMDMPAGMSLAGSGVRDSGYSGESYKFSGYERKLTKMTQTVIVSEQNKQSPMNENPYAVANMAMWEDVLNNTCPGNNKIFPLFVGQTDETHPSFTFIQYCGKNKTTNKGAITITKVIEGKENFYTVKNVIASDMPFEVDNIPGPLDQILQGEIDRIQSSVLVLEEEKAQNS